MAPAVCTALNLHDDSPCPDPVSPENPSFCPFHARQVQALYKGYKARGAALDALDKSPPKTLPKNYGNSQFNELDDTGVLQTIHDYLLERFNLVTRCLLAREVHHSHFYKDNSDFGHQQYLDRLRSFRVTCNAALSRIEARMLVLNHRDAVWLDWVKAIQAEEDARAAAEKKKNRDANALFQAEKAKIAAIQQEEQERRKEQMEKEEVWDPIDARIELDRGAYIALIKILIHAEVGDKDLEAALQKAKEMQAAGEPMGVYTGQREKDLPSKRKRDKDQIRYFEDWYPEKAAKDAARKEKRMEERSRSDDGGSGEGSSTSLTADGTPEGTAANEDMKKVLNEVEDVLAEQSPLSTITASPQAWKEFQGKLGAQMGHIREYLLLRLVLRSSALTYAALKSDNIDEFLANKESVRNTDLRDLALGLSRPSMQDMRNACADFSVRNVVDGSRSIKDSPRSDGAVETAVEKRKMKGKGKGKAPMDPPKTPGEPPRVRVCGKWIHEYPADSPLSRRGWYIFSLITGCSPLTAAGLCQGWDEFHELTVLASEGYFAGLNWSSPEEPFMIELMKRTGFVPYAQMSTASEASGAESLGNRRNRQYVAREARSYIAGNMSRYDPGARRFIALLRTYNSEVVCSIRDCYTGEMIYDPPEEEKWLVREKAGSGKLSRGKWKVATAFDKRWKATIESNRQWKFNFKDYLDVVIWDRWPGRSYEGLQLFILRLLNKAYQLPDHIAIRERSLAVFHRIACEEDGAESKRAQRIMEARQKLIDLRGRHSTYDLKGPQPDLFYTSDDEAIDQEQGDPYLHVDEKYWERDRDAQVLALIERMNNTKDEEERARLDMEIMLKAATFEMEDKQRAEKDKFVERKYTSERLAAKKQRKAQQASGADALRLTAGNEVGALGGGDTDAEDEDSDWEDEDSEDDSEYDSEDSDFDPDEIFDIGKMTEEDVRHEIRKTLKSVHNKMERGIDWSDWKEKRLLMEDLEEKVDDISWKMHHTDAEINGHDVEEYEAQRRRIARGISRPNMNARQRQRYAQEISGFKVKARPANMYYCQFMVGLLWPESDPEVSDVYSGMFNMAEIDTEAAVAMMKDRHLHPPSCRPTYFSERALDDWTDKLVEMRKRYMDRLPVLAARFADGEYEFSKEWCSVIQKRVTQLWREGAIEPSFIPQISPAIAGLRDVEDESKQQLDFYVDYRDVERSLTYKSDRVPPDTKYLRAELAKHAAKHPNGVYSLLRMKSQPDYWPFVEPDQEEKRWLNFVDQTGTYRRLWTWNKIPKDYPFADGMVHNAMMDLTIEAPSYDEFGNRREKEDSIKKHVRVRVDTVLVFGEDERECRQWTEMAAAYFRKKPRGFEIDWLRSFLGATKEFMEGLEDVWWT